jgi:hypothetical protein
MVVTAALGSTLAQAAAASASNAASSGYVKAYENTYGGTIHDATPNDMVATAGGGDLAVASADGPGGVLANWLVRTDAKGRPRWSEDVGCLDLPPGDYTIGVAGQQTADGGYVLGGGTNGCGFETGAQRAFVEKLGATGQVAWAATYDAGAGGSAITQIRQTADGGYVAAGNATDGQGNTGALVLRLDPSGAVVWQRTLGPSEGRQAYLYAVLPLPDGGVVAAGDLAEPGPDGVPITSVLVVRFDANGDLLWQRAFNASSAVGALTAKEQTRSVQLTSDGGILVAGAWWSTLVQGAACCTGALLIKLDADGTMLWQRALSGGSFCQDGACEAIGAYVYSLRPESGGGYLVAGDGDLVGEGVQIVPWMAEVDANGNLVWQHLYFEVWPPTGRPLSEYFAAGAPTSGGGAAALGYTEDYQAQRGELYAVRIGRSGGVGGCGDVRSAPALNPVDPGLVAIAPALTVGESVPSVTVAPVTTLAAPVAVQHECG